MCLETRTSLISNGVLFSEQTERTNKMKTKMTVDEMVDQLIEHAKLNYEKGWDTFVECYSREDWRSLIDGSGGSYTKSKAFAARLASVWSERQADADYHRRQATGEE